MRYLISRPDKIGDVILALHGAKQLKRLLPQAEVYMHVGDYTYDLVKNVQFIDGCVRLDEDLRQYRFDAVVDLMAKFETARRYSFKGIRTRIGNSARWFQFLYNRTRYIRRSHALMNEAEHNWQLISLLDPSLKNTPLVDSLSLEDFREITEFNELANYTALMPGVSVSAEAWPLAKWIELARLIAQSAEEENVLFLLGPAEMALEQELKAALGSLSHRIQIRHFNDLKVVLGVLKNAKAYVGPSTGITHLASAVGVPGVGLYPEVKSMHPNRWQPFGSSLKICSPASQHSANFVLDTLVGDAAKPDRFENPFLSAFVICKNEEENIRRCLESIRWCDEIVVVDSGSTDRTLEICREFQNVRIFEREWPGHREQKQFALEQCRGDWVLNLDSDEEVSPELRGHIQRVIIQPPDQRDRIHGYYLCRVVYFLNRWWDRGGWYPEYRLRFFQRRFARWGGVNPHEKAIVTGPRRKLPGHLFHYTFSSITDLISTLNNFSRNSAETLYRQGERASVKQIMLHPLFRFFKFYFLKRGYREGLVGFIIACSQSFYTFLKYAKLWECEDTAASQLEKSRVGVRSETPKLPYQESLVVLPPASPSEVNGKPLNRGESEKENLRNTA